MILYVHACHQAASIQTVKSSFREIECGMLMAILSGMPGDVFRRSIPDVKDYDS